MKDEVEFADVFKRSVERFDKDLRVGSMSEQTQTPCELPSGLAWIRSRMPSSESAPSTTKLSNRKSERYQIREKKTEVRVLSRM